jgi:RNA polymerase sigma-70 factor (ECF subfamily)
MTDEELLERACRGDEAAFCLLYERYRDRLFRFAYRMLGAIAPAEDVTHDCFLHLIENPSRFNPHRAQLCTYLYAVARNLALKRFRQAGAQVAVDDVAGALELPESENPLGLLLGYELAAAVRKAVARLPPLQREALILFEYEELSLADIAQIVGADVGTVKARLFRARQRLKRALAPYLKDLPQTAVVE